MIKSQFFRGMCMLKDHCRTHLILALDVINLDKAIQIASAASPYVDAMKIGLPLGLSEGVEALEIIKKETGLPIIADMKIADVCHMAGTITRLCLDAGANAVTVHGFFGPSTIKACISETGPDDDIIVMTESTHSDASFFMEGVSETIAKWALNLKASGIQAPGTRPKRVRELRKVVGNDMTIVSCGMGVQGGKVGSALKAGADFEIYGRSIYESPNPAKSAEAIAKILKQLCD
jgi:orotidine-5'-phosphate decarboxylase